MFKQRCTQWLGTLAVSIVTLTTNAQDAASSAPYDAGQGRGVEVNWLGGRILKHAAKFTAPIPPMSGAVEVNCLWQTFGRKEWHQRRKFPLLGVGATITDYGYSSIFGYCVSLYPNIQIPLVRRGKFEWTVRIGDGIAYVTKKYQATREVDTVNNAISTNLNNFAIFVTDVRYRVNAHWDVQGGANFTHISNGLYREPNLGINMYGLHVGVRYFPVTSKPKLIMRDLPELSNRWLLQLRAGIGFNQSRTPGQPECPNYVGSMYVSRRWQGKNKMFVGTDFSYHESNYQDLRYWSLFPGNEWDHSWYGAFFAGNEFLLGRVGVVLQAGVYYHEIYLKQDPVYEKLGGNYYLIKREHGFMKELFASCMVKTHRMTAEFIEFGIGVGM
jgi:hypothetical protein